MIDQDASAYWAQISADYEAGIAELLAEVAALKRQGQGARNAVIEECAKIASIHAFLARQSVRSATGPKARHQELAAEEAANAITKAIRALVAVTSTDGGAK